MKPVILHASCVAVGSKGVLLLGASGAGKSDLALRLVDEGAQLVADDSTEIFAVRGVLRARALPTIAGLLEVRGLGIIAVPHRATAKIALVVRLDAKPERLPRRAFWHLPAGLEAKSVPMMNLCAYEASAPAKIRLALAAFSESLFRDSFNSVPARRK